jgi:hypothetical protein
MTYKTLQTNFERELLFHLIFNMKKGRITKARGQKVAKAFLQVLKTEQTIEGFINTLSKEAQFYPEIREAFLISVGVYEKENVQENLAKVRQILKGGAN